MVADILRNKKPNPIVRQLFSRSRKLNIYLGFKILLWGIKNQAKFYLLLYHKNSKQKRALTNRN